LQGVVDGKAMVGQLEQFGQHVLEVMWNHLKNEFPEDSATVDELSISRFCVLSLSYSVVSGRTTRTSLRIIPDISLEEGLCFNKLHKKLTKMNRSPW
jgi:hypothetical protein